MRKSLIRRSRKLTPGEVKARLSMLVTTTDDQLSVSSKRSQSSFLSKVRTSKKQLPQAPKRKPVEVVQRGGEQCDVFHAHEDVSTQRPRSEALGLKMVHQAIKEQNHNRELPSHQRHDYEYSLRKIATSGVVRLFNSLKVAQRIGSDELNTALHSTTVDKAQDRKVVASRAAFLASLHRGADPI